MVDFVDSQKRPITRKKLILTAANQDGGSHIDPSLDAVYADLTKNNSLGWVVSDGNEKHPLEGPEKAAIRQIAHEVLKSLESDYQKIIAHKDGLIIGGTIGWNNPSAATIQHAVSMGSPLPKGFKRSKDGNKPCPCCNSGKKFKKCCGKNDNNH